MGADAPAVPAHAVRRFWLTATLVVTVAPVVGLALLAPGDRSAPGAPFGAVLFLASSVHVASTGWFYTVAEVRPHLLSHPGRYVLAPAALVTLGVLVSVLLPSRALAWTLVAFFGWQFFHFQKQNLGVAALCARAGGAPPLTAAERRALVLTGIGGVVGVCAHPRLLQLGGVSELRPLHDLAVAIFAAGCLAGMVALARRPAVARPLPFLLAYCSGLLFFAPVWLSESPYAAVAGLTIAHGLQYLLLIGLVAGAPTADRPLSLLVLLNVALLLGLALSRMAHLHGGGPLDRALFGVYLGLSCAHFVVDAGVWRLRDEFPRTFLTGRLPYLLAPERVSG